MSTVLAEFLQQFFTFIFVAGVVVVLGRNLAWVLLLFVPVIIYSSRKIGTPGAQHHAPAGRTSWPRSRTSCTKPSPATAS